MKAESRPDGSTLFLASEEDSTEGFLHAIPLFPGISLCFFDIHSAHWPSENLPYKAKKGALLLRYSVAGSSKMLLDKEHYILLKQGDISVTGHFLREDAFYPEGFYQGIEIFVDPSTAEHSIGTAAGGNLPELFSLNFHALARKYNVRGRSKIGACPKELRALLTDLWAIYPFPSGSSLSPEQMALFRLEVLHLLMLLQYGDTPFTATHRPMFRSPQLKFAEQATLLLCEDLRKDWTLLELSEELGVSESSLKRYFLQLYGCSVAKYQQRVRMKKAAELLQNPENRALSILDVALEVGYENQSKFAAVFKRHYGESPLEYKKKAIAS